MGTKRELVRLIADLAEWAQLPIDPVDWYVQALRTRVDRALREAPRRKARVRRPATVGPAFGTSDNAGFVKSLDYSGAE